MGSLSNNAAELTEIAVMDECIHDKDTDASQPVASKDSDPQLVRRMADGDQNAFVALLQRHINLILAFAQRQTGSREDAEEIAQEVFLRAWQSANQWENRGIAYTTWLHRVTLNLCHDRWRRREPVTEMLDESTICPAPRPDEHAIQQIRATLVSKALQQLPERQRAAVILSHYQGMTNIEASSVLNISVEAVESLLGRARRKLRTLLVDEILSLEAGQ